MGSLEKLIAAIAPSQSIPAGGSAPVHPPSYAGEEGRLEWGSGGSFGNPDVGQDTARTSGGGGSTSTRIIQPDETVREESYSFDEVSRVEVQYAIGDDFLNDILRRFTNSGDVSRTNETFLVPNVLNVIFKGPERVKNGWPAGSNSRWSQGPKPVQLYRFTFPTPDPFHRIVGIRVNSNESGSVLMPGGWDPDPDDDPSTPPPEDPPQPDRPPFQRDPHIRRPIRVTTPDDL